VLDEYPDSAPVPRADHEVNWDFRHHVVVPNTYRTKSFDNNKPRGLHVSSRNLFDHNCMLHHGTAMQTRRSRRLRDEYQQRTQKLRATMPLRLATTEDKIAAGLSLTELPPIAPMRQTLPSGEEAAKLLDHFHPAGTVFSGCWRTNILVIGK